MVVAGALLLMVRSARAMTSVVAVELSLPSCSSVVALVAMTAVFDRIVPSATELATVTVIVQVTLAPLTRPALVHVTVPGIGLESAQSGLVAETKLVPLGIA